MDEYDYRDYPDVDEELVEFLDSLTGVHHHQPREMSLEEKKDKTVFYLEILTFKGEDHYMCRLFSELTEKWYVEKLDYVQYQMMLARVIQSALFGGDSFVSPDILSKKMNEKDLDEMEKNGTGINIGDQIAKMREVSERLQREKREEMDGVNMKKISDADANYTDEELVSEDEFKKMWGE